MATSRHGRHHGIGRAIEHAIVIKGPISGFTRAVLSHYLHTLAGTGVVFSHNNGTSGSACELPFLDQLAIQYPSTFAYVLSPPPPNLGRGFRNAQREACFHGVRVAIERWAPRWVMVHRPDAGFLQPDVFSDSRFFPLPEIQPLHGDPRHNFMEKLAVVAAEQPPVGGDPPASLRHVRRLGNCPFQLTVNTFYGRFTVDDHCVYGRARDVLEFWSLAPPYRRDQHSSTELDPEVKALPNRRACRDTGPESENGLLWVERMRQRGWAPPRSELALIRERMFVLNPIAFGYVAVTAKWDASLPVRLGANNSNPAFVNQFARFFRAPRAAKYHLLTLCRPRPDLASTPVWQSPDDWRAPLYNCSLVDGDPSDPTTGVVAMGREAASFRDWPCPLPDSKVVQRKWGAPRAECSQ